MIAKSLYLENFRIYKGPEELNFAEGDKNITIIKGNNDAGKTTMLNAISWCLYGTERNTSKEDIWNKQRFSEIDVDDKLEVIVKMEFEDPEKRNVTITRTHKFIKINENSCNSKPETSFTIYIDDGLNDKPVKDPEDYINTHLPSTLKDYFIFDGELLTQFFAKDNGNIKKDVFRLSQLNLLEKVSKHVQDAKSDYLDEKSKKEPKYAELKQKQDEVKRSIEEDEEELTKKEHNITKNEKQRDSLKNQLLSFGNDPFELISQRDALNRDLKDKDKEIKKADLDYKTYLVNNINKIFGYALLEEINKKGDEFREQGFIPSQYKKSFLEFLLEQEHCICGSDLTEGSEAYQKIDELCQRTSEITNISDFINTLLGSVNTIKADYPQNFLEVIDEKDEEMEKMEIEAEELQKRINIKNEELRNISEEEIKKINSDIDYYDIQIKEDTESVALLKSNLQRSRRDLKEIEKDLKEEEAKKIAFDELDKKIKFCEKVHEASQNIYKELVNETHRKLQDLTTEEFNIYHWKDSYEKINIDDDFNVTFIKKDGTEVSATDPSAGTQLTLALSFITALNSLAGFQLPIFVDTPLGRLDNDIRNNLGEFLPKYTKNKQLTLLVTGAEYSSDFKKNIEPYVGKEYSLDVINEEGKERTRVI